MATLQKIRSKGPLLVVVIGLALFAFIAGDAWKVLQPHQGKQEVGEINGKSISAQEYQKILDEYTEIVKMSNGTSALSDDQMTQLKDQVWQSYVNNQLIKNEANKIGLTVSDEEIKDIIEKGTDPMLRNTPFVNPQTGMFDKDILKKFLAEYAKMDRTKMPAQYVEYYETMNKFWIFVEKELRQTHLAQKYQNLISKAMLANPVEAQAAFDARANQFNVLLGAVPYTSIADSAVTVTESDLKALYNKKKEEFKQYAETRNVKYIDVQVRPSEDDRNAVKEEVTDYTNQLANATDFTSFIRSTDSEIPFVNLFYNKSAYPNDVRTRLDSVKVGEVYGPYYNQSDDSYNAFKLIARQTMADSIEYRQIHVFAESTAKTQELADSIYKAIKGGADFAKLAQKYNNNPGEAVWLTANDYENKQMDADNTKYINAICNLGAKELVNLSLGQRNIIIQVLSKKEMKDKYKVAVIKRPVEFSKETYNKAYNNFSQFIASNGTLEKMEANAEENGYRLLERKDFYTAEHTVGGVKGTREAIRWIFDAEVGEVSPLYECGESDHLLVVALTGINEEGYRSMNSVKDMLKNEIVKNKKAEKIIANIKAKNLKNFEDCKTVANMTTDSVKHISFANPVYVALTRGSEPVLSGLAANMEEGKLSEPVQGKNGVYVMQVYKQDKLNETFDVTKEQNSIKNINSYRVTRFINDLYLKANVKDTRYLFF